MVMIDRILEQCGGCMLAVSVLAHIVDNGDTSLGEIVQLPQKSIQQFDTVEYTNDTVDAHSRSTIYTVCHFALQQLALKHKKCKEKLDNCYHYLYALASFPAAQAVARFTLRSTYECIASVCSDDDNDNITIDNAVIADLKNFGLILRDSDRNCQLHAIIADYVLTLDAYKASVFPFSSTSTTEILAPSKHLKYTQLLSILVVALHDKQMLSSPNQSRNTSRRLMRFNQAIKRLDVRTDHVVFLNYLCDRNYAFSAWRAFELLPSNESLTLDLLASIINGNLNQFLDSAMKLMKDGNITVSNHDRTLVMTVDLKRELS
jgi:hypothetical protein